MATDFNEGTRWQFDKKIKAGYYQSINNWFLRTDSSSH